MCSINRSYNTSYNDNLEVPPYTGMMFEVTARRAPVIIKAFELDLRLENATDLAIEVYSLPGSFEEKFDQPSEWTLVADTEVVLTAGGGGGIVPVQKFTPVRIDFAQRQSFYITMKGPYLDHNVDALQKTGEVQSKGDDLQVFVGAGLTEYRFPNQLDTILDPMFAGVIHYEKEYNCDQVLTATTYFDFPVLFEDSVGNMVDVTTAINDALDEIFKNDPEIKAFVTDYDLTKSDGQTEAVTYTHTCPNAWKECPNSYLHSTFRLVHEDSLKQGKVLFELYRSTDRIMEYVRSRTPGIESVYIGFESAAAEFGLTLTGVPAGAVMDNIQQDYFVETTKRFLVEAIRAKGTVYDIQIDSQELISRRRLGRSLMTGVEGGRRVNEEDGRTSSVKVQGIIRGALPATIRKNEFRFALSSAFTTGDEVYLNMLSGGSHLPGPINKDDEYILFENIAEVSSHFKTVEQVADGDETGESSSGSTIAGIVGGIVAVMALVLAVFFLYRHRTKQKRHKLEVEEYRKQMKEERREKRLIKANSKLSDDLVGEEMEQSLETAPERSTTATPVGSTNSSTESKNELQSSVPNNTSSLFPAYFEPQRNKPASLGNFLESPRNTPKSKQEFDARSLPAVLQSNRGSGASLMSGARKARNHHRSKEVDSTRSISRNKSAQETLPSLESMIGTTGRKINQQSDTVSLPASTLMSGTRSAKGNERSKEVNGAMSGEGRKPSSKGKRKTTNTQSSHNTIAAMRQHPASPQQVQKLQHAHSDGSMGSPMAGPSKLAARCSSPGLLSPKPPTRVHHAHSVGSTGSPMAGPQKLAARCSSPGMMSPEPPTRVHHAHSVGSTGSPMASPSPARKLSAGHSSSSGSLGPKPPRTPQRSGSSSRRTVNKASSCRPPQSAYTPSNKSPARPPPSRQTRRAHSLGDMPPPLK